MLTEAQMPMLSVRAAPLPQTFDREANTVNVVWTTGAQVRRFDWLEGPFVEELVVSPDAIRLDRLNSGAPVLDTHEADELECIIGVVERAWIENGEGMATVRFSMREDVQPYVQDIAAGIIRNVSVGYQVHKYEVTRPADGSMPIWRAVDWEPMEISIVPIPADVSSQVRSKRDVLHPVSITTRGDEMSELENEKPADEAQASPVIEETVAVDAEAIAKRAIAEERQRIVGVRSFVKLAKLDESVAESLIDSGKSLDDCRAEVLRLWSESVDRNATPSGRPDEIRHDDNKRAASIAADLLKQVAGVK